MPQLGIFVRLAVEAPEFRKPHTFRFALKDPDGTLVVRHELPAGRIEPPQLADGEERFLQIALNIGGLLFARAGLFSLEFHVDDELMRALPLPVVALTPEELARLTPAPSAPAKVVPARKKAPPPPPRKKRK